MAGSSAGTFLGESSNVGVGNGTVDVRVGSRVPVILAVQADRRPTRLRPRNSRRSILRCVMCSSWEKFEILRVSYQASE
jgi:hypothetical protein